MSTRPGLILRLHISDRFGIALIALVGTTAAGFRSFGLEAKCASCQVYPGSSSGSSKGWQHTISRCRPALRSRTEYWCTPSERVLPNLHPRLGLRGQLWRCLAICRFTDLYECRMPESSIAPFLTTLQERVKKEMIRVGSYPKLMQGVDVSLIGKDESRLKELAEEVVKELKGELVAQGKLGQEAKA